MAERTVEAEQLPTHLYKYVSSQRLSILTDGLIRFTQPNALNDPFEIRPVVAHLISDAEKVIRLEADIRKGLAPLLDPRLDNERVEAIVKRAAAEIAPNITPFLDRAVQGVSTIAHAGIADGASRSIGVLSLSENPKSSLMWAHYAENYQGVVLEFDTRSEFFQSPPGVHEDFGKVRKVLYTDRRPALDLGSDDAPSMEFLWTKPREWSYEAEWRMLRPLSAATKRDECEPFSVNLYAIPQTTLTAVILGFRATRDTFDLVYRAIKGSLIMKGAALKAVRPGRHTFDLEILPVRSWEELDADQSRLEAAKQDMLAALEDSNALADLIGPSLAKRVFRP